MSSEKIVAAEKALEERRDQLLAVSKQYDENPDPETLQALEEANEGVELQVKELNLHRRVQDSLTAQVTEKAAVSAPAIVKNVKSDVKDPVDYLFANAVATLEAHARKIPYSQALEGRFGNDEGVKAVSRFVTKALGDSYTDTPPLATTFTAGWAEELTRQAVADFLDLLSPEAIVPRLPLTTLTFGGNTTIKVPMRAADPQMDAEFIGEGDAIPVKYAGLTSKVLRRQKMGVIGTYTSEIFEHSTPNIVEIIRNAMIRDTAIKLDTAFLSNLAGTDYQPAGMQNLAGTPIDGSGMGTVEGAIAAIKSAIVAMSNNLLGARPAWVMHPSVAWSLQMMTTAIGQPAFPEMANGTLVGIPVYTSVTAPVDLIFLIDCAEIVFAYEGPRFAASDQASLHMANPALPLNDGTTVAAPVRSLFQSDSMALRTIWHLTWDQMRDGAVVLINDVAV